MASPGESIGVSHAPVVEAWRTTLCTTDAQCGTGKKCYVASWDSYSPAYGACLPACAATGFAPGGWEAGPPTVIGSSAPTTKGACVAWCNSNALFSNECRFNGAVIKTHWCGLQKGGPAGWYTASAYPGSGDGYNYGPVASDENCASYCSTMGLGRYDRCINTNELVQAGSETWYQPSTNQGSGQNDEGDSTPDPGDPAKAWDCSPKLAGSGSTFSGCTTGTTQMAAAAQVTLQKQAGSYLEYLMKGTSSWSGVNAGVPTAYQGATHWSTRSTAMKLCMLRKGVEQGKVRVRHLSASSICGKRSAFYRFEGTLDGLQNLVDCKPSTMSQSSFDSYVATMNTNPAAQAHAINRSLRFQAGACPGNDAAPTFFHASHYWGSGDSRFVIDPEVATLDTGTFTTTASGATAAATLSTSNTSITTYRYGSSYPKRIDGATDRTGWIMKPCVVGTSNLPAGTAVSKVWIPYGTTNYLTCDTCGMPGTKACPDSTGAATVCDMNGGAGVGTGSICNCNDTTSGRYCPSGKTCNFDTKQCQ